MVNNWLRIGHILSRHCYLCGQASTADADLCLGCRQDLPRIEHACQQCGLPIAAHSLTDHCGQCLSRPPPFDQTHSAYIYAEPIKSLITRMKFAGNLALARLLGELLRDELLEHLVDRPEAILPVPLHARRIRQRGFNQSIELARALAKQLGIPLLLDAVERRIDTPAQTGLSKKQRAANLRRAFIVNQSLSYQHIAILDDVITTGQTTTTLAACLKKAGVKRVDCWSVARALPGNAK